jgi:Transcriptional regulator, AbiEi antitoxin/Protein of unknown function (DUF559)
VAGGELGTLFRESNWVLTTEQLVAAGVSRARIARLVRQGVLESPRRGTYVPVLIAARAAADPRRAEALQVSTVLARRSASLVASHRSAAVMHGLDTLAVSPASTVTVTQPPRAQGNRSGFHGARVYTAVLPDDHVTRRFLVPCTTVARTVVDLARCGTLDAGVVVADSALHMKLARPGELTAVLEACGGWPGVAGARRAIEFSDGRAESALESLARVAFDRHGLELPEPQVWLGGEGLRVGRVDFYWRRHRTIAEADGKAKYRDDKRNVTWQLERDAMLREAGFEVVHFTWAEIVYAPEQVIARIRAAFARAARLGVS